MCIRDSNDAGYEARVLNALEEGPQSEEEAAVCDQFTAEVEAWKATDRTKVFEMCIRNSFFIEFSV